MRKLLCALLLWLVPATGQAACSGTDLIAALPAADRDALQHRADATPHAEGLLWQAVRGDTRITLFGTYHFAHERTADHLIALQPHIDRAGIVYLELSGDDQGRLQAEIAADPSLMFLTDGPTLPNLLGEADWQRFAAEMTARTIPSFVAAKFKPIWAMMMLGVGPCDAQSGILNEKGIDEGIAAYATEIGTDSRSLDAYRTLLSLLDHIPRTDQIDMIRLFLDRTVDPDDIAHTLRLRYMAQQTALIWEYSRQLSIEQGGKQAAADFALFEEVLLTRRNAAWAAQLTAAGVSGEIFVAVGAGHLPGDIGLLRMLERQGFAVNRLPFDP